MWTLTLTNADSLARGRSGDEIEDAGFTMTKARRRSNSSLDGNKDFKFKTKFETIEQEPVFEESVHGDGGRNHYAEPNAIEPHDAPELEKQTSSTDSSVGSFEDASPVSDAGSRF